MLGTGLNFGLSLEGFAPRDFRSTFGPLLVLEALPLAKGGASLVGRVLSRGNQLLGREVVESGLYAALRRQTVRGIQANHLNQDAAYGSIIPKQQRAAVRMRGNAFTQPGTQHFVFHKERESFWAPYRRGGALFGQRPSNAQYSEAVKRALSKAGFSRRDAARLAREAGQSREAFALRETDPVPRIPNPLRQRKE